MAERGTDAADIAGLLGFAGLVGILTLAVTGVGSPSPPPTQDGGLPPSAPTPPDVTTVCQLCSCNGGVVPCQIPGTTLPDGTTCAMCNDADGVSVTPCYGTADTGPITTPYVAGPYWPGR